LVITDLRMEGMDGMALFEQIHYSQPALPVIILTAHGTIPDAVEAANRGVFGYLTKPFDSKLLLECVERALRVAGQPRALGEDRGKDTWRSEIVSRSTVMEDLLAQAHLAADSEASILIQSDSGTGKELLARAIHKASRRKGKAFVPVNCAAIPEQLLESELFGHSKGAFTGAEKTHEGLCLAADGGTLFLDEIGDMPLSFQAKLLRFIQEREVRPVGSTKSIPVDVRIISATHRNLEHAITEARFREDLFYRLNVVMLELPSLADRREDIPVLANHFLEQIRVRSRKDVKRFSPDAIEALLYSPWPGNIRQLYNVVEQCVVLSTSPIIPASLVRRALRNKQGEILSFAEARDRFERDYLVQILQITEGNVSQAARLAGRNRTEFYKLLNRHHLQPELFREAE
jgi:two-component system response regulator GlrR